MISSSISQTCPQVLGLTVCCRICHRTREALFTSPWLTTASSERLLVSLTLGVLEVVPPQGTDLVLATHVPHGEANVLVLHRLYIET